MRKDEEGNDCPATLGEYRDMVVAIAGEDNKAVWFLDQKIKEQGCDEIVIAPDLQMRAVLLPMMLTARPPEGTV